MQLSRLAAALVLSVAASLPAFAGIVYTYTGNQFTEDSVNATPARLVATMEFDIADNFSGTAHPLYNSYLLGGKVTAGSMVFHIAPQDFFPYDIEFVDGEITGWYFSVFDKGFIADSLSHNYKYFGSGAYDDVRDIHGTTGTPMSNSGKPGSWTHAAAADVPEPSTIFLLAAGAVMLGIARGKQKQAI